MTTFEEKFPGLATTQMRLFTRGKVERFCHDNANCPNDLFDHILDPEKFKDINELTVKGKEFISKQKVRDAIKNASGQEGTKELEPIGKHIWEELGLEGK